MNAVDGYAWICLSVRDLGRSVDWYRAVFGFDAMTTNADTCALDSADRFTYLIHPSTLLVLGLQQNSGNDDRAFDRTATGLDHLTLGVPAGALDSFALHLDSLGIPTPAPTRWKAGRFVELFDPDGIAVRIFELGGPTPPR